MVFDTKQMLLFVILVCCLCANTLDARRSKSRVEDWYGTIRGQDSGKTSEDYKARMTRLPRIWSVAQDTGTHTNPCTIKTKQWLTKEYLGQMDYEFEPDSLSVKQCSGSSDIVQGGCYGFMDCVSQYERKRFLRRKQGEGCTAWHHFEKDIPIGCDCMLPR